MSVADDEPEDDEPEEDEPEEDEPDEVDVDFSDELEVLSDEEVDDEAAVAEDLLSERLTVR